MSLLDEIVGELSLDAFEKQIVLIVLTGKQLDQILDHLRSTGQLVEKEAGGGNFISGVPFEVNDNWVGPPGMLTEADVQKYRGARRSLDLRMEPTRRLEL